MPHIGRTLPRPAAASPAPVPAPWAQATLPGRVAIISASVGAGHDGAAASWPGASRATDSEWTGSTCWICCP